LAVAAVTGLAPEASAATSHHVMAYVELDVKGIYYSTSNSEGIPITRCVTLPSRGATQWIDGQMDVRDGRPVTIITFGSWNCTDSYMKRFDMTAPQADGLTNWWVNLV
jgi:hypothetical protein